MKFLKSTIKYLLPASALSLIRDLRMFRSGVYRYKQDGLYTVHNCKFMEDEKFLTAYSSGEKTGSWRDTSIHWRAHVILWAANKGLAVEGDFVECGVNKGGLSSAAITYTDFGSLDRKFWLLDTYQGLDEKYISDEEREAGIVSGGYEDCYESVKNTFAKYTNVLIIKGAVPETLSNVTSEKIAFLSIDMNCVEPEIEAAKYFWPKLSSGAVVVLDDYAWQGHEVQQREFDKFAAERGVSVLTLPTGQGLIVKP